MADNDDFQIHDQKTDYEYPGEREKKFTGYPREVDIDDGIERSIKIKQEIFGEVHQYGKKFEVVRFTLSNKERDGIHVQVSSLGAALVGIKAPDRKNHYEDIVLGFDNVDSYYGSQNPGFGRITSLCPLPYDLAKIVWDWDFDRDEGSVTFSTAFYNIDVVLTVRYMLTTCNNVVIDIKACGAKILPLSLTNQVYWNLAGHSKGEEAMKHHVLSLNSSLIWHHDSHNLKNFIPVGGSNLDFRIPTIMDDTNVFGENAFEHVYVVTKGLKQGMCFMGRLIHPRTCRFVEIYSDHPWMLCYTLNKMPKIMPEIMEENAKAGSFDVTIESESPSPSGNKERIESFEAVLRGEDGYDEVENETKAEVHDPPIIKPDKYEKPVKSKSESGSESEDGEISSDVTESSLYLDEIPGKEKAFYKKYGSFCITPSSDLSGFDPILRPGKPYSHRIIYKVGIYRRYMRRSKMEIKTDEAEEKPEGITDIETE